jgi:hypothetical protein
MKIKDVVYNNFHGIRRYGVVVDKYTKDSWAYVKVQWVDDEKYESAMSWREKLGQGDHRLHEYRVDQVTVVDAEKELTRIRKCLELVKE